VYQIETISEIKRRQEQNDGARSGNMRLCLVYKHRVDDVRNSCQEVELCFILINVLQ